jgi:signal transduction histidine kinase
MPPTVRLDRDTLLTIQVQAPSNIQVKLPPIEDRLTGFTVAGSFDRPAAAHNGNWVRERHVRLTPQASTRYRIAPMAVTWHDRTGREQWFPTRPLVLFSESLVKGDPGTSLAAARLPVRIYPGWGSVLRYATLVGAVAALGALLWWAIRRIRREVQLRRMSPRERALHELAELLARDLIGKDRVKDFYFELTMIVRAYIERAHAVRAPEQTTEEFLAAVSRDPRFSAEVVARLRAFMQAADLVKYAADHPDQPAIDQALGTARTYIETDAADTGKAPTSTISHPPSTINH